MISPSDARVIACRYRAGAVRICLAMAIDGAGSSWIWCNGCMRRFRSLSCLLTNAQQLLSSARTEPQRYIERGAATAVTRSLEYVCVGPNFSGYGGVDQVGACNSAAGDDKTKRWSGVPAAGTELLRCKCRSESCHLTEIDSCWRGPCFLIAAPSRAVSSPLFG